MSYRREVGDRLALESASRLSTESARVLLSWKVPSRPPGRAQDYTCIGRSMRRSMSLTGRSRSRWTERNTRARPGPWSLSPEAPATGFANPSADPARILVVATPDAIRMVEELSSNSSGPDKPELRQVSSTRQSILRRSRHCMPATTASWSQAKNPAGPGSWRNLAAAPRPASPFLPGWSDRAPRTARSPSGDPLGRRPPPRYRRWSHPGNARAVWEKPPPRRLPSMRVVPIKTRRGGNLQ